MNVLLIVLLLITALACLVVGAFASGVRSSDPAGNGLAQAYVVFALGITWCLIALCLIMVGLRAPVPGLAASFPWNTVGSVTLVLFLLAVAAQTIGLPWLFNGSNRGPWRTALCFTTALVPLAFVLFAAWRGAGLVLPAAVATWGCGAVVVLGSLVPIGARAWTTQNAPDPNVITIFDLAYPALLLHGDRSVRVVRSADDLEDTDPMTAPPFVELMVVDAGLIGYTFSHTPSSELVITREAASIAFDALCAQLLRIPKLADNAEKDAEIRRLILMQRDVTALSFVLDR